MVKDILQNTVAESGNRLFGGKESFGGFLLCAVGIDKSEDSGLKPSDMTCGLLLAVR